MEGAGNVVVGAVVVIPQTQQWQRATGRSARSMTDWAVEALTVNRIDNDGSGMDHGGGDSSCGLGREVNQQAVEASGSS